MAGTDYLPIFCFCRSFYIYNGFYNISKCIGKLRKMVCSDVLVFYRIFLQRENFVCHIPINALYIGGMVTSYARADMRINVKCSTKHGTAFDGAFRPEDEERLQALHGLSEEQEVGEVSKVKQNAGVHTYTVGMTLMAAKHYDMKNCLGVFLRKNKGDCWSRVEHYMVDSILS